VSTWTAYVSAEDVDSMVTSTPELSVRLSLWVVESMYSRCLPAAGADGSVPSVMRMEG
jgi:hypothetical protein